MGDQLNQNQIDDLLKRLTSGGEEAEAAAPERYDGRVVKDYNFNSPKKFTKEQLKILEDLHETFGRVVSTQISGLLRQYCEVTLLQVEEQLYYDFSSAIPDNALIGFFEIRPEDSRFDDLSVTMNISTAIGYYLVERMLGGQGGGQAPMRAYTELEVELLRDTIANLSNCFETAWRTYMESQCTFTNIETNSRLMQNLNPKEIVVLVMFEVKINSMVIGSIDLCFPASSMGDLINNFSNKYQRSSKRVSADAGEIKKKLYDNIIISDVVVKAVLDELILDVQDVMNLQVNDIIPLDKSIDSNVTVVVDGIPWFDGKLGEVRQHKAVKLVNLINQDTDLRKDDFYGG